MTDTRLSFVAPEDLSVGRVIIEDALRATHDLLVSPGTRSLELETAPPGVWTAHILPVGLKSRTFTFEVLPGISNRIASPLYITLGAAPLTARAETEIETDIEAEAFATSELPSGAVLQGVKVAGGARTLSLGLATGTAPRGWAPYLGPDPQIELEEGGVNVLLASPDHTGDTPPAVRFSMALQGVRVERFLLPQFRGGLRVSLRPSPLSTTDVGLRVTPLDLERRALVNALCAGDAAEAQQVFSEVVRGGDVRRFVDGDDRDPWATMVAALLTIRFPEIFDAKSSDWGPMIRDHYGWSCDGQVIFARHCLATAGDDPAAQRKAARAAVDALARGQAGGAPYFAYANQLLGDLLHGLSALEALAPDVAADAERELERWRGNLPLQRQAGAVFAWLKSDPELRKKGRIAAFKATHARLEPEENRTFFRAQAVRSRITVLPLETSLAAPTKSSAPDREETTPDPRLDGSGALRVSEPQSQPSRALAPPPANDRPVTDAADANKGRFGGLAARDGYRLNARFEGRGAWITIHLSVTVDPVVAICASDPVEFHLHSSFKPARLTASFHGHEAKLTVRAWGGFTVGVWIPTQGVELECDLAEIPGAPEAIRLR